MIDANCQRSASFSALVLSNPYRFGSIANSENLMVTPLIFRQLELASRWH